MLLSAILGILSLVLMIAVGVVLCGKKWFSENGPELFSKFIVTTTIPCYMFTTVYTVCESREQLAGILKQLPIPFCSISAMILLSLLLARLFKIDPRRRGVFVNAVAFCNTVLVGMPVVEAIFGAEALPDAIIYFLSNMFLFWTVGGMLLKRDAGIKPKIFSLETLKSIFSPAICGALVGGIILFSGLSMPDFLLKPIEMIGRCSTPLAMIFTGCVIRMTDLKKLALSRELAAIVVVRFIVSPALMLGLCALLPLPSRMEQVFFAYSVMPAMTQLGILSKVFGSDYEFASIAVTLTTILSMIIIPVYIGLMSSLNIL